MNDDKPAPKPRVVLPAITKGIFNIATIRRLQERFEKVETELRKLKESAAHETKALEQRLEAQMEEKLKTRSEKMKIQLNRKLPETQDELQKQRVRYVSTEQVKELMESHPIVMAKMKESLDAARAEEVTKLKLNSTKGRGREEAAFR